MRLHDVMVSFQRPFRILAEVALVGLVVITAVDVIGRVVFSSPLGFAYELIGVLLGVAVYAGLIGMTWARDHIRIDLIADRLAAMPRFERVRAIFVWGLEVIFFTLLAVYVARQAVNLQRWHETFMFLPAQKWVPLAFFAFFATIAAISAVLSLFPSLKARQEDLK
ncbi:MAG: TRAP transporter small permease subunit [Thioclava marina]|uniref:TRAP transporter small permease n=1 Tax=Thioclava marina TaxID=1915077 RepID=UPI0019B2E469|nr:TRAP transporter small permease [Thioclava marina]MBC7143926.1 TRAP transporter small permease subunit [Thioclava marina]